MRQHSQAVFLCLAADTLSHNCAILQSICFLKPVFMLSEGPQSVFKASEHKYPANPQKALRTRSRWQKRHILARDLLKDNTGSGACRHQLTHKGGYLLTVINAINGRKAAHLALSACPLLALRCTPPARIGASIRKKSSHFFSKNSYITINYL